MFKIIPPDSFKSIPWKNGKGTTTELAISDGGSLTSFDWRLSIASVVEDGEFSDFSGVLRNLILIEGNGIDLTHDNNTVDNLSNLLEFATFDGGCRTVGTLHNGPIKDLNLMTRAGKYKCRVDTWIDPQTRQFEVYTTNFVFSLSGETKLFTNDRQLDISVSQGHLGCIEEQEGSQINVTGEKLILIRLQQLK